MPRRPGTDIQPSEITPEPVYHRRRQLIAAAGRMTLGGLAATTALRLRGAAALIGGSGGLASAGAARADAPPLAPLDFRKPAEYQLDTELTDADKATSYNNFYELGTGKSAPKENAAALDTEPWSVTIEGEVNKPGKVPLETLLKPHELEQRIYRLRCVEAWSMVIPWVGFELGALLKRFEPTSKAKYVAFETVYDPTDPLPGQRRGILDWPYREGLRIDEAMHPLTILAVGMYGKELPNQNGAPLRLVVPWKYGFKSIKSIVKIRLQEEQPETSWNMRAPNEYGFYANVNPNVNHPRWSQAKERRIGDFFKIDTQMFNGYADQVAHLYEGMDLRKHF